MCDNNIIFIRFLILIVEIASNIISLSILPLPYKFEKDYLEQLTDYKYYETLTDMEDELSSPRKTVTAIIVFGSFLCLVHFIKIIIFISERNSISSLNEYSRIIDFFNVILLFINWCMSISIIPKLNKVRGDGYDNKLTDDIKDRIIGVICLYSFCYVYIFIQYCIENIYISCKKNEEPRITPVEKPKFRIAVRVNNDNDNITTTRNIATNSQNVETSQAITTNRVILLSNILPEQVYRNIKSFIELGKAKLIMLTGFFIEMKFDGLTDQDSIINEISLLVVMVGKILSEVFDDRIVKALIDSGSEDHIMLLLHYIFPFIVAVIKMKIEKGLYKRSPDLSQINLVQVLTRIERKVELDEQGNIQLSFRISKQVNQIPLERLLNP